MKRLLSGTLLLASLTLPLLVQGQTAPSPTPKTGKAPPAPAISPSPIPSSTPSGSPSPQPARIVGLLKKLELVPAQGSLKNPLRLFGPKLPQEVSRPPNDEKNWAVSFRVESEDPTLSLLHEKKALKLKKSAAELTLSRKEGKDRSTLSTVSLQGELQDYDLQTEIEVLKIEAGKEPEGPLGEPKGFALLGPTVMGHSLSRSGTAAAGSAGSFSGIITGVRGVYRRRVLQKLTDNLPGQIKVYLDGAGTIGYSIAGDSAAQGMPLWLDARATVNVYEHRKIRFETGLGTTFFMPILKNAVAGDLSYFFGLTLTGRVAVPLSPKLQLLGGVSFSLPNASTEGRDTLVNQPLELFLSGSIPRGERDFLELRFKYFQIKTSGSIVGSGTFSRSESFYGPEVLWVWRL